MRLYIYLIFEMLTLNGAGGILTIARC